MIVSLGEIMLRLFPEGYERLLQKPILQAYFGGGEANVAVSAACFGLSARYVTKLPNNSLGYAAEASLRARGVDTSCIAFGGKRLGLYFTESGANQRASTVLYDRDNSAISEAEIKDFDWDKIFDGAKIFHITGITPAISKTSAELSLHAVKTAREKGVLVSCDLNFRKKLWNYGKNAPDVMKELVKYVDILIANEEDLQLCLGYEVPHVDVTKGELCVKSYEEVAKKIFADYANITNIAVTLRSSISANHNNWSALIIDKNKCYSAKTYNITNIVDRIGGGDSFSGGLLSAMLMYPNNTQYQLDFAVAASALKHSIPGDYNLVSKAEVETLAGGDGSGRVQR